MLTSQDPILIQEGYMSDVVKVANHQLEFNWDIDSNLGGVYSFGRVEFFIHSCPASFGPLAWNRSCRPGYSYPDFLCFLDGNIYRDRCGDGCSYLWSLIIGSILALAHSRLLRELLSSMVNYLLTIPVLLIAIFVMVLLGPGQLKLATILVAALTPTQALYVYVRLTEAQKQPFAVVKRAFGLSRVKVFSYDLVPYIHPSVRSYTLSRLPEILVMDLAFNYLGLGIQPPHASLGRMLFSGLPFMFAGWWMWLSSSVFVVIAQWQISWPV